MAKLANLIRVINLLSGAQAVPIDRICAVCGVARRTAYRYLTDISEGIVPVYFDREKGGYKLLTPQHIKLDHLTRWESIMLICALSFMCRHVNELYRKDYIRLVEKIQLTDCALVGEVVANLEDVSRVTAARPDYSDRLTTAVIELAIANRWGLRIEGRNPEMERQMLEFYRPRLRYDQGWVVEEESVLSAAVQEVSGIIRVEVITP